MWRVKLMSSTAVPAWSETSWPQLTTGPRSGTRRAQTHDRSLVAVPLEEELLVHKEAADGAARVLPGVAA
jgi:hypothetical protein